MTLSKHITKIACAALGVTLLTSAAAAQNIQVGFNKSNGHGGFSIGANVDLRARAREIRVEESERHRRERYFRTYVPAHYETICQQVWIQGCWRDVWVEPVYSSVRDARGCYVTVCVRAGYWTRVQDAGHYENREVQVWVAGRWV